MSKSTDENPGRLRLVAWRATKPNNFYTSNPNLAHTIGLLAGPKALAAMEERLLEFGRVVATDLEELINDCERLENLPVLRQWSPIGQRTEAIEFHPSYHEVGRRVWASGMLACRSQPGAALEQAALFYLLAHHGEGGHCCPVACTTGLIRALQEHGSDEVRRRFLAPLLNPDYDKANVGSQFFTEIQTGSDIGSNLVWAEPDPHNPGRWTISGEKWFCSVANAQQFLVSARIKGSESGTAGLGTFVVPRTKDDGRINGFSIRRLKTKLGTRAMASGEIDFQDAEAYAIGDPADGFRISVECVLNTSRWINALGCVGLMHRAYLESYTYAHAREAFGGPIARFPLVRESLAILKTEEMAALSSTLFLSRLIDLIDTSQASDHQQGLYRILVNANKYITSIAATESARTAVEVLGGNGTIEDFSPVPRLVRDAFVYESWEGTHNVLAAQVLRDSQRFGLIDNIRNEVSSLVGGLEGSLGSDGATVTEALAALDGHLERSLSDRDFGASHFRHQLTLLARIFQAARLLYEAAGEAQLGYPTVKADAAALFIRRHLDRNYDRQNDPDWQQRIDRILGNEI